MTRTALIAALVFVATGAAAQEAQFTGKCTDYRELGKEACVATGWCRWSQRKAVKLPNGTSSAPVGYCAFKRGHKAGYQQTAQQPQ